MLEAKIMPEKTRIAAAATSCSTGNVNKRMNAVIWRKNFEFLKARMNNEKELKCVDPPFFLFDI